MAYIRAAVRRQVKSGICLRARYVFFGTESAFGATSYYSDSVGVAAILRLAERDLEQRRRSAALDRCASLLQAEAGLASSCFNGATSNDDISLSPAPFLLLPHNICALSKADAALPRCRFFFSAECHRRFEVFGWEKRGDLWAGQPTSIMLSRVRPSKIYSDLCSETAMHWRNLKLEAGAGRRGEESATLCSFRATNGRREKREASGKARPAREVLTC
eukprot:58731-Rhodomonas_salina.2